MASGQESKGQMPDDGSVEGLMREIEERTRERDAVAGERGSLEGELFRLFRDGTALAVQMERRATELTEEIASLKEARARLVAH